MQSPVYALLVAAEAEEITKSCEDEQRLGEAPLEQFWEHMRAAGRLPNPLTVSAVSGRLVDEFIALRRAQGVSPPTISRDLAALRGPIN